MGRKAPLRLCTFLTPNKFQKLSESDDAETLGSQAESIADQSQTEKPGGALDTARRAVRLERKRPTADTDEFPPLSQMIDAPTILPKEK